MGEALNPAEAARYLAERHGLKVSVTTIRRWAQAGYLRTCGGERWRTSAAALDAVIRNPVTNDSE